MENEVKTWLKDIEQAILEIEEFLPEQKNFNHFLNDMKTRRAVERNIEIIGEAVNRILLQKSGIQITNARKIVDTRNRIIHGYDSVSAEILWAIVLRDIPSLKIEIQMLMTGA
jgi:uncharacterized protein with HEPN domain